MGSMVGWWSPQRAFLCDKPNKKYLKADLLFVALLHRIEDILL